MSLDDEITAWEAGEPDAVKGDVIWRSSAYRMSSFASDWIWSDLERIKRDFRTVQFADQLVRAVASISVNFSEGYSRSAGRDRCRFYEYALGSARESREWWLKCRHVLPGERLELGVELFTRLIRILSKIIGTERKVTIRPR